MIQGLSHPMLGFITPIHAPSHPTNQYMWLAPLYTWWESGNIPCEPFTDSAKRPLIYQILNTVFKMWSYPISLICVILDSKSINTKEIDYTISSCQVRNKRTCIKIISRFTMWLCKYNRIWQKYIGHIFDRNIWSLTEDFCHPNQQFTFYQIIICTDLHLIHFG